MAGVADGSTKKNSKESDISTLTRALRRSSVFLVSFTFFFAFGVGTDWDPIRTAHAAPTTAQIVARITALSGLTESEIDQLYAAEQAANIVIVASDVSIPVMIEDRVGYLLVRLASTGEWQRIIVPLDEWDSDFKPYLDSVGVEVHKQPRDTIDTVTPADEAAAILAGGSIPGSANANLVLYGDVAGPSGSVAPAPAPATYNPPSLSSLPGVDSVGATAGQFRVNESGAATYSVPIAAAAGTAGVAPQISLNYSSAAGNGVAGQGWSIGGLSSITRCRKTWNQDRSVSRLTFSDSDRFCLDGQRLVLDSPGEYGDSGTEYRTEIESGAIVTIDSVANGEPASFSVKRKDGSLSHYGQAPGSNDESAKLKDASNRTLTWSIRRFTDSVGNPIWFQYDSSGGAQRISEVRWAYGSSTGPDSGHHARMVFGYESRSDKISGYVFGSLFQDNQRLKTIDSYNRLSGGSESIVRTYHLDYNGGQSANDTLSRLVSLQECVGQTCLPATTFGWNIPDPDAPLDTQPQFSTGANLITFRPVDINGDSKIDLVWLRGNHSTKTLEYALSDGSKFTKTNFFGGSSGKSVQTGVHVPKIRTLDYNLDGRQDVAYWDAGALEWFVLLARPTVGNDWRLDENAIATGVKAASVSFVDLDSNGTMDVVYPGTNPFDSALYVRRLMPEPWHSDANPNKPTSARDYYRFGPVDYVSGSGGTIAIGEIAAVSPDFNGDGRVDLLMAGEGQVCVEGSENGDDVDFCDVEKIPGRILTFSGVETDNATVSTYATLQKKLINGIWYYPYVDEIQTADINQDGLADLLYPMRSTESGPTERFEMLINKGDGNFESAVVFTTESMLDDHADVQLADWNSDAYPDLVWRKMVNGDADLVVRYWRPDLAAFGPEETITSVVSSNDAESTQVMDVNGDAVADLVKFNKDGAPGTTQVRVRTFFPLIANRAANRVGAITNGLGLTTTIEYRSLSNTPYYTRLEVASATTPGAFCEQYDGGSVTETFCFDAPMEVDSEADFYSALNGGFGYPDEWHSLGQTSPVLEFAAPMYVVTQVTSDAPAAGGNPGELDASATSRIQYHYGGAKIQAAGRGFLGFSILKTVDIQSGVETLTRYRQDWPFIGAPIGTVTKSASGKVLGTSRTEWEIPGWGTGYPGLAESNGTASLGPLHAVQNLSVDSTYDLANNGAAQGSLLSTVTTETDYYLDEANPNTITVTTTSGDGAFWQKVETDNDYHPTFPAFEARVQSTEVTTTRSSYVPSPADPDPSKHVRTSTFDYYSSGSKRGLLSEEAVEPGSSYEVKTNHDYDAFGNLNKSVLSTSAETRCDVVTAVYDGEGRYLDRTYDCLGNLIGRVTARNEFGSATEARQYVDANGSDSVLTRTAYSVLGREYYQYTDAGASTTSYVSNNLQNCPAGTAVKTLTVSSTGAESQTCTDIVGRENRNLTRGFNGEWHAQDTEYDSQGRTRFVSDPYVLSGNPTIFWTRQTYDLLGRPLLTTLADSSTSETSYAGFSTTLTNDKNQNRTEHQNVLGETTSVVDHLNGTTAFAYDLQGNMASMTDDAGQVTVISFDLVGNKKTMSDPDKGNWSYEYNAFNELEKQTDAKLQVQEMTYDGLGRMRSRIDRQSAGGSAVAHAVWNYDSAPYGLGQVDLVQDLVSGFSQAFSFDSKGRPSEVTTSIDSDTYHQSTTYDQYGRVFQVFDAAGDGSFDDHGIRNHYNGFGFVERIADAVEISGSPRTVYQEIVSMNARGQVTARTLGDGRISTILDYFDQTGRLYTVDSINTAVATQLQDLEYRWDTIGNLEYRKDLRQPGTLKEDFLYDNLNRLTDYTIVGGSTTTVSYNSIGNITSKSDVENGGLYDYSGSGGPHAVSSIGSLSFAYDNNGNMETGDGRTIDYTVFDKPSSITRGGHTTAFEYGPERSRYQRTDTGADGTTTTRYVGNVEIIERPDGNEERKRYIGDFAIVTVFYGNNSVEDARETNYRLNDHLGSIGVATDSAGHIVQEFAFDPWGQRRAPSGSALSAVDLVNFNTSLTTRGFTGHEMLDEVGLVHMNGRIYDQKIARFVQADPFVQDPTNTQSLNRYSYVLNNPMNATDPSGYFADLLTVAFLSFAGGKLGAMMDMPVLGQLASIALCGTGVGAIHCAAIGSFSSTIGSGGDLGDAFKGAVFAGLSAATFTAIGGAFKGDLKDGIRHVAAHAIAGGVLAELQGGKFGHGFVSAGLTKTIMTRTGFSYEDRSAPASARRVAAAAVIGGTISEVSGGKFANGAVTAAFAHAFNQESGDDSDSEPETDPEADSDLGDRPSYKAMEDSYPRGEAKDVMESIGGKVAVNAAIPVEEGGWANSCSVRISVCLNLSGHDVPYIDGETVSGRNRKWHLFRVRSLEKYLTDTWGAPDIMSTTRADFSGTKGLIIFDTTGTWSDATGHATLWDGSTTVDSADYFDKSSRVLLWKLPD